jgi:catechol 2,3-dioxygenase-like lactoylglutathione lyase family enzyme
MDLSLELVVLPVSDVDRAKAFYVGAGFALDVDHQTESFRVVQLTPPGSRCSVALMRNDSAAGSVQGLHLVVTDLAAAREELVGRGVPVGEPYHFGEQGQVDGVHPDRADFASFAFFADPDGNGWLLQERSARS